ncbi:MAG: carbohydrate ABC transporter permease [Oscillospiraceae bacterium]|nr:carbohydrate ABC transporter permease [Oscillospiraceae bacterium]
MDKLRRRFAKGATYVILFAGAAFILLPFVWMILTSLKPANEVLLMPPKWLPSRFQWENYVTAFQSAPFVRYFCNSVIVTVLITAGELLTTLLAAFAFAQIPFRGKQAVFLLLVATMMVPSDILIIPNFVTLANFGWIDTYKALALPWCASVFSIFLLRQQFASIPQDYYKAARMDGCRDLRYLFTILVPMSRPTIVSIALLKIINSWNAYLWPLIATNSNEMRTLPVGLAFFSTEAGVKYNTLMAFSLMIILPTLIVYLLTQKYIIQGVSKTGLKG